MPEYLITTEKFSYIRMSILNWMAGQFSTPSIVTTSPGKRLAEIAQGMSKSDCLFINMKGITSIDEYALSFLCKLDANTIPSIVFLCDYEHQQVRSEVERELATIQDRLSFNQGENALVLGDAGIHIDQLDWKSIEQGHTNKIIAGCFEPFSTPKRLSSTPITANGEFNARAIIQKPASFVWVAVSLADKVESIIKSNQLEDYSLMAVSLRGSPFAFAVWQLLQSYSPRIEIIDHLGPVHELLEDPDMGTAIGCKTSCIFIGDFVIGGSELKVARSHAVFHGKQLEHAVCIGSALEEEAYGGGKIHLNSIVRLSECREDVTYQFIVGGSQ